MRKVSQNLQVETFRAATGTLSSLSLATSDFEVTRLYWIRNVPSGEQRGMHAHKSLRQIFLCLSGKVSIKFDDGNETVTFNLDSASNGITVEPGLWRELYAFSEDALVLVVCDQPYDEDDYIRNYDEFLAWRMIHHE
jgi:dTDP-4-dehydrorhamnose 3,5-epimerase-like enzyme